MRRWRAPVPNLLTYLIGLWNAVIVLSLFAAVAVQKNVRDLAAVKLAAPISTPD